MDADYDLLAQTQDELELSANEVGEFTGLDRREFVFLSLVAAAASTFGVRSALAQGGARGGAGAGGPQQAPPPPIPLGNGEPPAMQFQAYPGGTGALMEKLIRERGAKAFERPVFAVEKWSGALPASDEDIAFLPAHRLSVLLKARKITSVSDFDSFWRMRWKSACAPNSSVSLILPPSAYHAAAKAWLERLASADADCTTTASRR